MEKFDLVINNCNIFEGQSDIDIAISDGLIVAIGHRFEGCSAIDAEGGLITPGFIDSHTHLDRVLMPKVGDVDGLEEAIKRAMKYQMNLRKDKIATDIKLRASKILDWQIASGSTGIKTHIAVDEYWGLESLYAINELKRNYMGLIDVKNITPWHISVDKDWRIAAKKGYIDFIAGYPGLLGADDYIEDVDFLFLLSQKYALPLDLHVNESDNADIRCFEYVLNKTIEMGMQGRVTCSHVTALSAVDDETAKRLIELTCLADVNVITLPSCNMYLMGRHDKQPIRRGITRVVDLMNAGVNVAYASDNIRDCFRPFGNGDMLEEGLFTAQVIQYGTESKLSKVMQMGTYNAAKNTLLGNYGLSIGCRADIVIHKENTPAQVIISQTPRTHVIKEGKIVAKNGVLI